MSTVAKKAWVYGQVQGVGFRYHTQQQAKRLGLTGHAWNLDDGSVEVLMVGEAAAVAALICWLEAGGPRSARVDSVRVEPCGGGELLDRFSTG
ncbi:acylphosphatase [Pantoea sp. 1.19]|uniref:acylphosphatase n=1 Tax=Pantoea sp. 1.19 TaxID=1925589 RepID=UPI00094898F4|nr:acylphosphatase [Pantoea sp. 1.19]